MQRFYSIFDQIALLDLKSEKAHANSRIRCQIHIERIILRPYNEFVKTSDEISAWLWYLREDVRLKLSM